MNEEKTQPIDMLLFCPDCGEQHIDAQEPAVEFEPGLVHPGWDNPPHKSHLCHGCGCIWRPADVPTNGVACLTSRGKADTWRVGDGAIPTAPASVEALIRACYDDAACFPEMEDPRTSDWMYDDNHLCAEAIRKRGEETAREYVKRASPSVNEEKTEAAGGVGSSQPERFTDQAKPRQCWAVEMGWERKACETPCAMKKCNPAGVAIPAAPNVYEQRLRAVLDVIQRYLPPDGIDMDTAMNEIIGLVDPWPSGVAEGPIPPDAITVNLVRFAGLDKHKARECEAIVRQVLAAHSVALPFKAEPEA